MNTNVKKSLISFTAAAALAVTGLGLSNATTTKAATQLTNHPSAVHTNTMAILKSAPSADAKGTGRALSAGTDWAVGKAAKDDQGNTWYYVATNEWVSSSDVTVNVPVTESAATNDTTSAATADNVISTAKQYLGTDRKSVV